MESMKKSSGSPATARPPDQVGEPPAELSLKPPEPVDEMPTTAAELVAALLPLGKAPVGKSFGSSAINQRFAGLQRLGLIAALVRKREDR